MIDFHTHHERDHQHIRSLLELPNCPAKDMAKELPELFCYGAHPWYLDKFNFEVFVEELKELKSQRGFIGLGEIGLDRTRGIDIEKQKEILIQLLNFSEQENIKNIFIHCVRAFSDFEFCLKHSKYQGQIIFHDFHGNEVFCKKYPKAFFSFGASLLTNERIQKLVQDLELDQILLETDDQKDLNLDEIYQKLGQLKQISVVSIEAQMQANLSKLMA